MKKYNILYSVSLLLYCMFLLVGCLKRDFDMPPDNSGYDPNLPVTTSIAQLQDMPPNEQIKEDLIISGVVGMADKEGNYYKKITIQDASGGIEILLDQSNLYNDFPVGRKVYVQLKGLYFGYYRQNPQIGYTPDAAAMLSNIPFGMIDQHIVKGPFPHQLQIDTLSLSMIADPDIARQYLNKIIALKDLEFADIAIGLPYADPAALNAASSRRLQECSSAATVDLRTSGFASFQAQHTPEGRGTLVALYTRNNALPQLTIRNPGDVDFSLPRCSGTGPVGPATITIDSLRRRYNGTPVVLNGITLHGVVISDRNGGNIQAQNMVIQQGDKGIMVRFANGANHSFNVGDSVEVVVNGVNLEEYRGLLQVNGTPITSATKLGTGTIVPKIMTIAYFNVNPEAYESVLVTIPNAMVSGGGTYSGTRTLVDGTGTLALYTASAASYASTTVPATPKAFTGLIGQYNTTYQLQLRQLADVQ